MKFTNKKYIFIPTRNFVLTSFIFFSMVELMMAVEAELTTEEWTLAEELKEVVNWAKEEVNWAKEEEEKWGWKGWKETDLIRSGSCLHAVEMVVFYPVTAIHYHHHHHLHHRHHHYHVIRGME